MEAFEVGEQVQWKWMGRPINGVVKEVHFEPVEREMQGKKIKRNGSPEKAAYLVQSEAGNLALKLQTELIKKPEEKTPKGRPTPHMFRDE